MPQDPSDDPRGAGLADDDASEEPELVLDLATVEDAEEQAGAAPQAVGAGEDGDGDDPSVDEAARSMDATDRRHALLLAITTLAIVTLLAVAVAVTTSRSRAEQAAVVAAAQRTAAATLATEVAEDLTAITVPTRGLRTEAGTLATALEEHLFEVDRPDAEVDAARDAGEAALRRLAADLRDVVSDPLPTARPQTPVGEATDVLRALGTLRAEADALALEADGLAERADVFGDTVRAVTAALRAHGEVVEAQPATDDPDELVAAWEAERAPLEELELVARVAAVVPGLETWAGAHERFAQESIAWIDEATALLEAGEIDTYNRRLDEVLGGDDPFGFTQDVVAATGDALRAPVLVDLGRVRARADVVLTVAGEVNDALNELARAAVEPPPG